MGRQPVFSFNNAPCVAPGLPAAPARANRCMAQPAQAAAQAQTSPQPWADSKCGMASGTRKHTANTEVLAMPSAVPARAAPARLPAL